LDTLTSRRSISAYSGVAPKKHLPVTNILGNSHEAKAGADIAQPCNLGENGFVEVIRESGKDWVA
jgi:hypothetical protein